MMFYVLMLLAGALIGLIQSAPVGPMAIVALGDLLHGRRRRAWLTAIGCISGDLLVAWGALFATQMMPNIPQQLLELGIGAVLVILGGVMLRERLEHLDGLLKDDDEAGDWSSTGWQDLARMGVAAGVTAISPGGLPSFLLAFSWLEVYGLTPGGWLSSLLLMGGVAGGALLTWSGMFRLVTWLARRGKLSVSWIRWVHHGLAGLVLFLGLLALVHGFGG